jgi:hypothetical protein
LFDSAFNEAEASAEAFAPEPELVTVPAHKLALYSEWPKVGTTKIRNPLSMGFFDS